MDPGIKDAIPIIFAITKIDSILKNFTFIPKTNPIKIKNRQAPSHSKKETKETSAAYFFEIANSPSFLIFEARNKTG